MITSVRCIGDEHDFDFEVDDDALRHIAGFELLEGVVCPSCSARMKLDVSALLAVFVEDEESIGIESVSAEADNPTSPIPIEDRAP